MMIYYAIAAGGNGYFLYDHESLSGEESGERVWASAQTISETHNLYQSITKVKDVEYFKKNEIYGTIMKGDSLDIVFAFTSDIKSHYHPTTVPVSVKLKDLINKSGYKSIYLYSPLEIIPAPEMVNISQDRALILIGFKGKENFDMFKFNSDEV